MIFINKSTSVNGIIGLSIYHCIRFPVEEDKKTSKWDELQYRKMVFKIVNNSWLPSKPKITLIELANLAKVDKFMLAK